MRNPEHVSGEESLRHLVALLEFHASVDGPATLERLRRLPNEEARATLEALVTRAREDRIELFEIVRAWRRMAPPPRGTGPAPREPQSLRELVEGWIEMKRTAAEVYGMAANTAPTQRLGDRLRALADREEEDCARLLELL
ncbi:MAG TPA: hypothetical protein VI997_12745 [Candidatus Thermoplasmatota archaeon]|nr:hypothetical protein [Candidatus Thermoplasmatota archaeon]